MESLSAWLSALDLNQYAQVFADNDIDLEVLPALSEQDLESLGVSLGHRKKLLKAIAGLKTDSSAQHAAGEPSPGAPINLTDGERRQLTVMFCDLVGSTALAERLDPEELRAIIRAYQGTAAQIIESFGGHIAQYLGDGLLVYFGHPRAHEDDAARAVHAGLGIVAALSELNARQVGDAPTQLAVRIGIHTGLVVVGEIGGGSREQLALGDTPNLAARLQTFAAPDTVIISDHTRHLTGGNFECVDAGEQLLKGIAEPVRIWRITGVSAVASRFDAATHGAVTPLVGREHEVALLLERWQLAQDGEGQVVLLSGEAGIGKSRSVRELRERLQAEISSTLLLQCSSYYANSAFYPMIDNLERALKFGRDESPESKLDKLEALLVESYRRPLDDVRFVATILSIPCEARYRPLTMTPQRQKDETIRALVDIVEAAARRQPMVMLFEDAHWADPTSLEVLDLLIGRISHIPLLMVLTHRPEFQPRWLQHGHVTALNLSKLTRAQSSAMVSRLTQDKALPGDLLEQILAKTDGVPLYVEELTKSILESGELKEAGDRYAYVGSVHTFTIPATLRDSLVARLDRVPEVKEIAQIGAVIGREFRYELIAAIAPHANTELNNILEQLTDAGLMFRRGTPPDALYTFKHALVQDAAYDSLLKSRRRSLHATIAQVIDEKFPTTKDTEPEVLAYHLTAAGLHDAAIPLWQSAGELALKRMALIEAISHLDKGLELISTLPCSPTRDASELGLRTLLGTAWMALRGYGTPEISTILQPALALVKSLARNNALFPILWGLWMHVSCVGRVAESLDRVTEILDAARATGDENLLITGHMTAMGSYQWMGQFIKAQQHGDQVLALYDAEKHYHLADTLNSDPKTFVGGWSAQWTWKLGYPDRALRLCDEQEAHARRRAHPFDRGWALTVGAEAFVYRGEPTELRTRAEECAGLGREHGLPFLWAVLAPISGGVALIHEGKLAEGIAALKAGLVNWDGAGGKVRSPYMKAMLAEGMALTGDLENALHLIEEQVAQVERPGWEERVDYAEILRLKGWMLSCKGDFTGAEHIYLASLDVAREQQAKS